MDTTTAVVSIGSAILASGGFAAVTRAVARWKTAPVDATVRLTDAAVKQVDQLQEEMREARRETRDARQEAREAGLEAREAGQEATQARHTVHVLNTEVEELTRKLQTLIGWIHEPTMNLERLRIMVPVPAPEPGVNGIDRAS